MTTKKLSRKNRLTKALCGVVVGLSLVTAPCAYGQGLLGRLFGGGGMGQGAGAGGGGGMMDMFMMMMMMNMFGQGQNGGQLGSAVPQSEAEREVKIRDEAARLNLEQKVKELEARLAAMNKK